MFRFMLVNKNSPGGRPLQLWGLVAWEDCVPLWSFYCGSDGISKMTQMGILQ